ncbi:hypothetical protein D3C86_1554540 [compost metagenome]
MRASEAAVVAHSGSVRWPCSSTRARRPAGNMTTQRSASKASFAAIRVARVFSRVRLAVTHSTGMTVSASRGETRRASALAK